MKFNENGIITCYGEYSKTNDECRKCHVKAYCNEAKTQDGKEHYLERTSDQTATAMAKYAALPEVYELDGGETRQTWAAVKKFLVFLVSLHPTTLSILKVKFTQPEFTKSEIAAAMGLNPRSVSNKICESRPVAKVFHHPRQKKAFNRVRIEPGEHVYLAGPMTGLPELNSPAFIDAEYAIAEKYACQVVNPAYLPLLMGETRTHAHYVSIGVALVATSDVLVLLPGWENSVGSQAERAEAVRLGKRIYQYNEVI